LPGAHVAHLTVFNADHHDCAAVGASAQVAAVRRRRSALAFRLDPLRGYRTVSEPGRWRPHRPVELAQLCSGALSWRERFSRLFAEA
jgi:hypothetical protein